MPPKKPVALYKYKIIGDARSREFNEALLAIRYLEDVYRRNFEFDVIQLHPTDWLFHKQKTPDLSSVAPEGTGAIVTNTETGVIQRASDWLANIREMTQYRPASPVSEAACNANWHQKLKRTLYSYVWIRFKQGDTMLPDVTIELRTDIAPRLCDVFRSLCAGAIKGRTGPLLYSGCPVFRIMDNVGFLTGDLTHSYNNGVDGGAVPDALRDATNPLPAEAFGLPHDAPGVVSMRSGPGGITGVFYITTHKARWLDKQHAAVGRVVGGLETCLAIGTTEHNIWGVPAVPMSVPSW